MVIINVCNFAILLYLLLYFNIIKLYILFLYYTLNIAYLANYIVVFKTL